MINVTEILDRIKLFYDLKNDSHLAQFLQRPRNTVSAWKSRNAPDWECLFTKCSQMNFDYMIRGDKSETEIPVLKVSELHEAYNWQEEEKRVQEIERENYTLKAKIDILQETLIMMGKGGAIAAQEPATEPKPDKFTVIGRFGGAKKKANVSDQE